MKQKQTTLCLAKNQWYILYDELLFEEKLCFGSNDREILPGIQSVNNCGKTDKSKTHFCFVCFSTQVVNKYSIKPDQSSVQSKMPVTVRISTTLHWNVPYFSVRLPRDKITIKSIADNRKVKTAIVYTLSKQYVIGGSFCFITQILFLWF